MHHSPKSVVLALAGVLLGALPLAQRAQAQDRHLEALTAIHDACAQAEAGENDVLYSVLLDGPTQLEVIAGVEEGEVVFAVTGVRNLRAFDGRVQFVPSHLERVGFIAGGERAQTLEVARARGVRVRLGFFLGFDQPERRACLVRPPQSVTAVRADIAFVEMIDADGSVLAREDNDRLRAWNDDPARQRQDDAAGVVVGPPTANITLPEPWTRAFRTAGITRALLACHAAGVEREASAPGSGASDEAMAQVRMRVDARTGHIEDAVVEVGNVADEAENTCIVAALREATLPAIGGEGRIVEVRIPVRLHAAR